MSKSEIVRILLCFHFGSFRNFKHYYYFCVGENPKEKYPNQLSYNRFIQLERRVIVPLILFLKLVCLGECTGITFVDSTNVAVCKNKRIKRDKIFKGMAEVGKSTVGWFSGFKLHLVCNDKGELLNFCLTKGNVDNRNVNVIKLLTKDSFGKLYGDKSYISSSLLLYVIIFKNSKVV